MSRYLRAGRARQEHRRLIQRYLDRAGLTITEFAATIGVSGPAVSRVINGHGHSPRILEALRAVGVPEKLLCDPRREEAA